MFSSRKMNFEFFVFVCTVASHTKKTYSNEVVHSKIPHKNENIFLITEKQLPPPSVKSVTHNVMCTQIFPVVAHIIYFVTPGFLWTFKWTIIFLLITWSELRNNHTAQWHNSLFILELKWLIRRNEWIVKFDDRI